MGTVTAREQQRAAVWIGGLLSLSVSTQWDIVSKLELEPDSNRSVLLAGHVRQAGCIHSESEHQSIIIDDVVFGRLEECRPDQRIYM
jgi:hypothetical protein